MGPVAALDDWLAGDFRATNTALEEACAAAGGDVPAGSDPAVDALRARLATDGAARCAAVAAGRAALPDDDVAAYDLLGSVGMVLAALHRHEVDGDAAALAPAWAVAGALGDRLGVAPRYVFAHQVRVEGAYRTFTTLPAEEAFLAHNAAAVGGYRRAAAALGAAAEAEVDDAGFARAVRAARDGLADVLAAERKLTEEVDVPAFFLGIRPYFKPYRVGDVVGRGTNGGDFVAANEVDLLLGLCSAEDPFYAGVLREKAPYLPPEDQPGVRRAAGGALPSLLGRALTAARAAPQDAAVREAGRALLEACRAHAAAASFHHSRLVGGYLVRPAATAPEGGGEDLTASGPPLADVVAWLERLRDLRCTRDRPGRPTARPALDELRTLVD